MLILRPALHRRIVLAGLTGLLGTLAARTSQAEEQASMTESNKSLAQDWLNEAYNNGRPEIAQTMFAADFRWNGQVVGPAGPMQNVRLYRAAFPDIRAVIDDQVAEGDKVVTRWSATGTHKGEFLGMAPTGRVATVSVMMIWRVAEGQVAEDWTIFDRLAVVEQLRS
jgi:predicted ester cyclase